MILKNVDELANPSIILVMKYIKDLIPNKETSLLGSPKLSLPQADLCSDDSLKAHLTFNMSFKQHIYSIVSGFHRLGIPPDAGDCDGVGGDKPTLRYIVLWLN